LSFDRLFERLDLSGDGLISRAELRDGYEELIIGAVRDAALQYATGGGAETPYDAASAALATAPDAVVVCGYGEMGQRACDVLAGEEGVAVGGGGGDSGAWGTQFVAFDRNPSRVSVGLAKRIRIVYGDGASASLIRAAGVSQPRAIVVTYANKKRCLEATRRLRDDFPAAPIFVRAHNALEAEPLLQAGATEVVVEAVESVVRLASLLGARADTADAVLRRPLPMANAADNATDSGGNSLGSAAGGSPPHPEDRHEASWWTD